MVKANIAVVDLTYRFTPSKSFRLETQGLWTKEDKGDWLSMLLEYNISPTWFLLFLTNTIMVTLRMT